MTAAPPRRFALRDVVRDPRLALMLALGYSSGLPILLVYGTLSRWLRDSGVDLPTIGLLSYVALSYSFKFLWAPIIDSVDVPVLTKLLGRRRAWLLSSQVCVALGLGFIAFSDPARSMTYVIVTSALTAFAAATQDVVIDAWRIDAAPTERQGVMSATANLGYRLALLCAQAGALYLADLFSWRIAYLVMVALMGVGIVACLLSPRLPDRVRAPGTAKDLAKSFIEPVADLIRREGSWLIAILALVAIYRLPDFVSGIMASPLYADMHFTKSQVATISKVWGLWIGIAGAFAGGFAVTRLGLMPALLIGGFSAAASHLTLALLASTAVPFEPLTLAIGGSTFVAGLLDPAALLGSTVGSASSAAASWIASQAPGRLDLLTLSVSVENFAGGFAGTALIAYMSSLTSPAFAATQYALLSSLYSLPGKVVGGLSGFMVKSFGYTAFFVTTSTIGIPVTLLCLLVWIRRMRRAAPLHGKSEGLGCVAEATREAKPAT